MTLAFPAVLWGLLVLPAILLLYMLRTKRQDVAVSTVLLWQRARADLAAQRPARRLERSVLLLLQLLAAALVVLALARPQVALPWRGEAPTVIVMDTSASMQATDVAPSRFAVARSHAAALAASARGPVMVIAAGPRPRTVAPFADGAQARAALARLQPTDGPARLDQAITLAVGQRGAAGGARVEVFTDRAAAAIAGVTYHIVGVSSANVGIAGVNVERDVRGSVLVVQVTNAGDRAARVPVAVTMNGRPISQRTVPVPPGGLTSLTVPVAGSGIARIELGSRDALASDNVAYAMVGTPPPRVIVAGPADRVLTEALAAIPVGFSPIEHLTPETLAAADVVILNRTPPVDLPPGNYLLFGTVASNLPVTVEGTVRGPQVLRWSSHHPVMRYVDLTAITIGDALRLAPRGGDVLAEGETPLIWAYEHDGVRAVVVAFSPDQSDLPLHVGFPIFLNNALFWLAGAERSFQAGDTVMLPAGSATEALAIDPGGVEHRVRATGGRIVLPALERIGVYTIRAGGREQRLVVNPAPAESVIAPVFAPASPADPSARTRGLRTDLWSAAVLLALGVLIAEWWLWMRSLPRIPQRPPARLLRRHVREPQRAVMR